MRRAPLACTLLISCATLACRHEPTPPGFLSGLLLDLRASQYDSSLGANVVCSLSIGVPDDTTTGRDTVVHSTANIERVLYTSQGVALAHASARQTMQLALRVTADSFFVSLPALAVAASGPKTIAFQPYGGTTGPWVCDDSFPLVDDPAFNATPLGGHSATGTWKLWLVVPIG